jgi:vitamin B12 transporter
VSFRPNLRRTRAAAAALLCLSTPTWAQAQTPSGPDAEASQRIVVTASRAPQRVDQTLADSTLLGRERIEAASGRSLAELLGQQAGVQFWANGGLGKAATVSLRGLEGRHTLLLIDGMPYGSATLGTPTWENLPLEQIERIEIVRGPLSSLYGSAGVGGVVQLFTRSGSGAMADGVQPGASLTLGSDRFGQAQGRLRFKAGAIDGAASAQQTETRGFSASNERVPFGQFNPDRDGFRQTSGSAALGWRVAEGWRLDLRALASKGNSAYDDGAGADARTELTSESMSLALAGRLPAGWHSTLRLARSKDSSETLATASAFTPLGATATVQRQAAWENTRRTPLGRLLLLAERTEQDVARPGTPFPVSERSINALAAGLDGSAASQRWQLSLRQDRNSQYGRQTTGAVGWGVEFAPGWLASVSAGTSFVAPSFNQLYFPNFGNPLLQPEEGRHAELALRWNGSRHSLRVGAFAHRIRGYITPGANPGNVDAAVDGLALSWEARMAGWDLSASAERLDPTQDSATLNGRPNANFGKQLPRRTKEAARLAADTRIGPLRLGGTLAAFGPRFENAANSVRLGGFATLDLRLAWALTPELELAGTLNNSLDKRYETTQGYNQPGRQAFLTLRWQPRKG